MKTRLTCSVNGEPVDVLADSYKTLREVLREDLQLTGTKHGCELGECGTCAVLVDGRPILSCLALAADMEGRAIETVEGLAQGNQLHPLQAAFADLGAAQCGYCTPGILMVAKALLAENPRPTEGEVRAALAGNRTFGQYRTSDGVQVMTLAQPRPDGGVLYLVSGVSRGSVTRIVTRAIQVLAFASIAVALVVRWRRRRGRRDGPPR